MRPLFKIGSAGIICAGLAVGGTVLLSDPQTAAAIHKAVSWGPRRSQLSSSHVHKAVPSPSSAQVFPLFSSKGFETAGFATAGRYMGKIDDRGSLEQVRAAVRTRAERGMKELTSSL